MGFFDAFTGSAQRQDLQSGNDAAMASLKSGVDAANTRYQQGIEAFQPYADMGKQGQADQNFYRQAIGLGTDQERAAAQGRYFSDPVFQKITGDQQNMMMRNLNARGLGGSGVAAAAGSKIAYGNYGGWLDRVKGSGDQNLAYGWQGTQGQAGIRQQQAGMEYGYGATKAGNDISYANAMAGTRSIPINNMMGLIGSGMNAYGAYARTPRAV